MKPSICFVSLNNYAVLCGDSAVRHIGGAEVQQALLGKALAQRGFPVSVVVLDHGQPDGEVVDGIRLFKAYRVDSGLPRVRFLHPRATGVWNAMRRADADIYYQRGADALTGLVARWCRRHGRRFVFALAHDANCDPSSGSPSGGVERRLYHYGLSRADDIIAQTHRQQQLLRDGFGMDSSLVRSCCEPFDTDDATSRNLEVGKRGGVLWVGRLSEEKRPEWIVQLARDLPDLPFVVVGACNAGSAYGRGIEGQLASCANVTRHAFIPHKQMQAVFADAALLCSTSVAEGFPNVFMEAWSCGTPVLSTVDPDGLIGRHRLGELADSFEDARHRLSDLTGTMDKWQAYGDSARDYVRKHHSVAAAVDALQEALGLAVAHQHAEPAVVGVP